MFLDYFNVLISKIIFKKIKKNYFDTFLNKKQVIFVFTKLRFEMQFFYVLKAFLKEFWILFYFFNLLQINIFCVFRLFWCVDVKIDFLKKYIYFLIYFLSKNTIKNNHNHTLRHAHIMSSMKRKGWVCLFSHFKSVFEEIWKFYYFFYLLEINILFFKIILIC